jgi:thiol-disulfide isomerase/thioredoxin
MRAIVAGLAGLLLLSLTACGVTSSDQVTSPESPQASSGGATESGGLGELSEVVVEERSGRSHGSDGHRHSGHGGHAGHGDSAAANESPSGISVGDKVPEFVVTIAGKKRTLSELRQDAALSEDGTLVLTFWCSFCHSCRDVEQRLDKLAKRYSGKVGVIALDASAGETTEVVAEFAKENGLSLPIALNPSGTAADILGVHVTTTTIVIDSKGILRYRGQFGASGHAYAAEALEAVLAGEDVRVKKTRQKG